MKTAAKTVTVLSTVCTHIHPQLPELTGGVAVVIPAERQALALSLEGVVLVTPEKE